MLGSQSMATSMARFASAPMCIAATAAGAEKHLIKMDGAYLLGFGPRTVDAVKELSERLYGDRISD